MVHLQVKILLMVLAYQDAMVPWIMETPVVLNQSLLKLRNLETVKMLRMDQVITIPTFLMGLDPDQDPDQTTDQFLEVQ